MGSLQADNILSMALDKKADADLQRWQAITRRWGWGCDCMLQAFL